MNAHKIIKASRNGWRETDPKTAARWLILRWYGLDRWERFKPAQVDRQPWDD